ncbi:SusC/RagA family TonB-linked outer membrane protein [Proteiniphilum sp. UBA5480]|jgi:TonB-linked SusC/RagA family outer membrane protein|uniref:SusC/RagA family TonB-linked outer membrane protein n=1 Tax=Dysgonomonadaceae TaxID=2005520 RepID=UPI00257F6148|nr:TonB-dependent receptor [Proteiniphilum sp. UBA5480]MEA5044910.1 TonB-dependent receptor [Petrimonas sp.]HMM17945.1 TonB-dependent receptor [Petrimonas sp.]
MKKKTRLLFISGLLFMVSWVIPLGTLTAQNLTITGIVTDIEEEPLAGVTIKVQGREAHGTITDLNGQFSLPGVASNAKLEVSYVGMKTQIIEVKGRTLINIVLEEDTEMLEEVQIVAFGKQKKTDVVGAVTTINPSELKVPSSNLTQSLAGRLSGLISYQRSGEPGRDNADFFIRGVTTFGYSKSPLILLDGFEISANEMARIDPNNIASFSIMKDATSTALYGARGANGVILITTKEGREGTMKISFRHESSISMPTQIPEVADGVSYMQLYNEAFFNDNPTLPPYYSAQKIDGTINNINPNVYPDVDWYDELFTNHVYNQRYNLNINGGGKVAQYFLSASYNKDNGILEVDKRNNFNSNISIDRYNLTTNINLNLTPTTKASFKMNGVFERYNGPIQSGNDIFNNVMNGNPVDFPKFYEPDQANLYTKHILFGRRFNGGVNPYAQMVSGYRDDFSNTILAMFQIEQDLSFVTPGLSARASANIRTYGNHGSSRSYAPYYYEIKEYDLINDLYTLNNIAAGTESLGDPATYRNSNSRTYFEAAVNYSKSMDIHEMSSMLVFTQSEELNTISGNTIEQTLPRRNVGLAGRFTYNYDQRYMAELNFGYNGSERFSRNNQFGFFPSFGLGYMLSNEKFWSPLTDLFPKAKMKFTYGLVGNDAIGAPTDRFFYLSRISSGGGYRFGDTFFNNYPGYSIDRYSNFNITWEEALKSDLGLELNILGFADLMIDYFTEHRKKIYMVRVDMPAEIGLSANNAGNIGEVKSQGIDASIDVNHFINQRTNTWVQGRVNFTYATNKVLVYSEPYYKYPYLSRIGSPVDQQWGYVAGGIFFDEEEISNYPRQSFGVAPKVGDIRYIDVNRDGQIDTNDRVPIGTPTVPEILYGFGMSFGYKAFDLSFFFQGSAKSSFFINPPSIQPFIGNRNILKVISDDYWSKDNPNPNAFWPRLSTGHVDNNVQLSNWWLRNGDFLRLKNLELGFSMNNKILNSMKVEQLRFFVNGSNLFALSQFKLWDPEMGTNGLGYPIQRTYNAGLQLDF